MFTLSVATLIYCSSFVFASDKGKENKVDPNAIVSINENITIPQNVRIASVQMTSVTYDENHGIESSLGSRYCWQSCQASQGTVKLDSYSRARFEHTWFQGGGIYGDSGRVWSTNQGESYAAFDWEVFDALNSGVARTYYGI